MDAERFIADRSRRVDASGIRKVFDLAATLTDPIDLSIGQPDYDVPEPVKQAAIEAIAAGHNSYTVTQGLAPLREKIAARLREAFDWEPALLVTSGVSGALLLSLLVCVEPGDEVIFADPYFVMYKHLVNLVGGRPVMVDTYPDFRLHPERIRAALSPRSKILMLNSPSNPTGVVLDEHELRQAAEIAEQSNLLIISDEIYAELSYDGPCPSVVPYAPNRTLLLRGFSKGHAMTGWRLGYAAGPKPIIDEMTKLQQYTFVCAPSVAQHAGIVAMDTPVDTRVAEYARKRDLVYENLKDAFEVIRPSGGFYIFPKAPERFANASAFVEEAIRNNVLIIPGNVFSERDTHFRISYAADDETLQRGCRILRSLAA